MEECSATVVIQEAPKFDYNEKQQVQGVGVGDKCVVIHTDETDGSTDIAIFKLELEDCVENSTDKTQLCFNLNKEAGDLMCNLVPPSRDPVQGLHHTTFHTGSHTRGNQLSLENVVSKEKGESEANPDHTTEERPGKRKNSKEKAQEALHRPRPS
ncbi:hypothetical protein Pmani_001713 [Petrolisthes manimaculis]|uniref:Uncharacterized protein n=1 Tax=Petrolisthes manimaculis TaxID=1843537 RepID=A0AAE1TYY6_9EUCA|nr:hypothetical protein Pmani_025424 [Petrolisthes manimaculis]KAK4327841.1 hypothetical protein Pmani_001713 [Petrolisthes manimaculis]